MAAGVTLRRDALGSGRFSKRACGPPSRRRGRDDALLVDGAVTARGATVELHAMMAAAGPFGAGNLSR